MTKPKSRQDGVTQLSLSLSSESEPPVAFEDALRRFEAFPYQAPPLSARNWGHPLHSLCSYPSKMKPGLARTLVSLFTRPGDTVLDPFAGVGTVPFEACFTGRRGIAVDLSPFAFGVSAAKVKPPRVDEVAETFADLGGALAAAPPGQVAAGEPEIAEFYHPDTWQEVLIARRWFLALEASGELAPAHWLVKAATAHILHGNRPYALSRRSHGIIPIPPKGPATYKPLLSSLSHKLSRLGLDELPAEFSAGEATLAAAQKLPLADRSVDHILTSPPFLGTTDFLRQNRVRLWFYGMEYSEQRENRAKSDFLEGERDLSVYRPIFREFQRVMRPGGLAVLHLGVVKGRDMALELQPLAADAGFESLAVAYEDARHLESHGRTARGATRQHEFLFLRRRPAPGRHPSGEAP